MIRSLRRKFIAMTMAVFSLLLCVIFSLVIHFTGQNLEAESIRFLRSAAESPTQPGIPGQMRQPCFVIRATPWGQTVQSSGGFDLSDEQMLTDIVTLAASSESEMGILEDYSLRYLRTQRPTELTLVFVDISGEEAAMKNLKLTCAAIGLLSVAAFWGVSILLARWAVRPVERAWAEQRQFIADASHELKTPLTVILTNAELMQTDPDPQYARSVLTMAGRMRSLVESLLELARVDSVKAKRQPLDFSQLVSDAVLSVQLLYEEKGRPLTADVPEDIWIRGNEQQLYQLMDVLLDNGLKYSEGPGAVEIVLKQQRKSCQLSVTSPGQPLTRQQQKDVFKRFYRADPARSSRGSYGLGLAIAAEIASNHRGTIRAQSKEGHNTFLVALPTCRKP